MFNEIENGYLGLNSIFDKITSNDTILAFFPCVRFEDQVIMNFKGINSGYKDWSMQKKLSNCLKLSEELNRNYQLITKLAIICINKNIPLIIENPRGTQHYLNRYWCIEPKIIDTDRSLEGDYYKKPTQYWFINCEPKNNFIFEPLTLVPIKRINDENTVNRSMIHPQYANRFIRQYIIDE